MLDYLGVQKHVFGDTSSQSQYRDKEGHLAASDQGYTEPQHNVAAGEYLGALEIGIVICDSVEGKSQSTGWGRAVGSAHPVHRVILRFANGFDAALDGLLQVLESFRSPR